MDTYLSQFNFPQMNLFALYASLTAALTLFQQFYNQFVPEYIRVYIDEKIKKWFSKPSISDSKVFTLVVKEYYKEDGYDLSNGLYSACEAYLSDKLRSLSTRLEGCRRQDELVNKVLYHLSQEEEYIEYVKLDHNNDNIKLHWKFSCTENDDESNGDKSRRGSSEVQRSFLLCFDPRYKDMVLDSYIPSVVVKKYDNMIEMQKDIHLYTYQGSRYWNSVSFNHPFTFDALALDPELKRSIVDDLDRFIKRRDFYKKIGRAWKRGYLLYGPPGTGKSSLIAAIANYLKFSIYDLQLSSIERDDTLRNLMMSITNKSILVIEDIDCASGLYRNNACISREYWGLGNFTSSDDDDNENNNQTQVAPPNGALQKESLSLSGLLNFIDGLWSSCGDERIIILTTNYKERLDPALLRPGRMDMHIHMSYLRMPGFRVLASNYLGVSGEHPLFVKIEELLETTDVSPAEVAEELIRSEDPDLAFSGVVKFLQQKKLEQSSEKIKKKKKSKRGKKKAAPLKGDDDNVIVNVNNNCNGE